jgi:type II secretory pathway predicted ATPase ExeA
MYETFYGLTADPFRLSVESGFCFPHRSYARAKAYVEYALHRAEGFVMITGSPGTGKTTLVNDLLEHLPKNKVVTATLVSTQLEADDLLRMTAYGFGLESQSPRKSQVLQRLMEFFAQMHQQGLRTLLIIDEAQDLAPTALEELRLLTNLQRAGQPLLQIVLLGQESLADLLRRRELEQVHQRLIAAWQLEPLDLKETIGYVRYRLERAGWHGDPAFEPGVLKLVHEFSEGIPRRVNLICSRLLLHGCISELHTLTTDDARALIEELRRERLAAREGETASDDQGGNPLGVTQPAPASPEPAGEDPDEIDQGLTGPAAPANPPAASPAPTEPPLEEPQDPVAESAGRHPEPAAGAHPPEGPAEQAEPPVPSEQNDEEPTPRTGIRADQDADRSATPGLHWQYVPEPDEAAPTTHDPGEVPRHPRRASWIKALLLLGPCSCWRWPSPTRCMRTASGPWRRHFRRSGITRYRTDGTRRGRSGSRIRWRAPPSYPNRRLCPNLGPRSPSPGPMPVTPPPPGGTRFKLRSSGTHACRDARNPGRPASWGVRRGATDGGCGPERLGG